MVSRRAQSQRRARKTNRRRSLKGGFACGPACVSGMFPFIAGAAGAGGVGLFASSKSMNSENVSRKGYEYNGEKSHNKGGKTSKSKVRIELVKGKDKVMESKGKGKNSKGKSKGKKSKKTKKVTSETWILKKNNVVKKTFHNMKKGVMAYNKLIEACESKGYDKC